MEEFIIKRAKEEQPFVVEIRRLFHMYPEIKFEEFNTSKKVREVLEKLGYEVISTAKTGVIGILRGGKEGKVVALRADMDALPMEEESDLPYKSQIPGKAHMCGHDAHTAMLLGAAKILSEIRESICGTVKLIFQPAEEGGLGAKLIVDEGHLDDVNAVFGIHVWPELPSGVIGIREGPLQAGADAFKVVIKGKGAHGARPHESIDPIAIAVDLINSYQKIISREVNPLEPAVLSVTCIKAGTTFNVIPGSAEILGTIRTFSKEVRDFIVNRMKEITEGYVRCMRGEGSFELTMDMMPPNINDEKLAKFAREVLSPYIKVGIPNITMSSEDFSYFSLKAPTLFMRLGVRNEEKGIVYPVHHPKFNLDEDALWVGVATHSLLAYKYLQAERI